MLSLYFLFYQVFEQQIFIDPQCFELILLDCDIQCTCLYNTKQEIRNKWQQAKIHIMFANSIILYLVHELKLLVKNFSNESLCSKTGRKNLKVRQTVYNDIIFTCTSLKMCKMYYNYKQICLVPLFLINCVPCIFYFGTQRVTFTVHRKTER